MENVRLKLDLSCSCFMKEEQLNEHVATTDGMQRIEKITEHGRRLAVCGAGPSIAEHIEKLRDWDGDIWAINNTAAWLLTNGIKSTFYTVDPDVPEILNLEGIDSAILATSCNPRLREKFKTVQLFDMMGDGPTSVCRAPFLAEMMGYRDITLFGCEGSFGFKSMHVDIEEEEDNPYCMIVHSDGGEFITTVPMLSQTNFLAAYVRENKNLHEECGGLLRAIVNSWSWDVVAMTEPLINEFVKSNKWEEAVTSRPFSLREDAHV